MRKSGIHIARGLVMQVLQEAFSNDKHLKEAAEKLGIVGDPLKFALNTKGRRVFSFSILDESFGDWLQDHSNDVSCQFQQARKPRDIKQRNRLGQLSYEHRCHKRGLAPVKPGGSKNTRKSKKSSCGCIIASCRKEVQCPNNETVMIREVHYNYRHNHPLRKMQNLGDMRKSSQLRTRIRKMILRGKSIDEVREALTLLRNEFVHDEDSGHLKRDDFVTYDDVRHIYDQVFKTLFQKDKNDGISCGIWMDELARKGYFTYRGSSDGVYGFSSPWQLEQLRLFGSVFCFDGTHEIGGYVLKNEHSMWCDRMHGMKANCI
jgi:hypothetical protein